MVGIYYKTKNLRNAAFQAMYIYTTMKTPSALLLNKSLLLSALYAKATKVSICFISFHHIRQCLYLSE